MSNPLPSSITADKLAQKLYAFRFDSELRNVWRFRNYDDTDARSGETSPPVARIRGPNFTMCSNKSYTWYGGESYATAEGATIVSYSWDWNDGSPLSSGSGTTHVYAAGMHTITLTVTDSNGLEGKESKLVAVECCAGCTSRAVAAIGADGNGYVSLTGADPWRSPALGSAGQAVAYDPLDINRVYFGTDAGNIHRTSNAGSSIDIIVAVSGSAITSLWVDPVNRNIIWAGDAAGLLFRSQDWGLTFALVLDTGWLDRISSITVDPHNTQRVLFCGTNSGGKAAVGETTNWGATFVEINAAGGGWADDHTEATEIVFASGNTDKIYVSLRGGPMASSIRRGEKTSGVWAWTNASGITQNNMGGVTGKVTDQDASWAVEDNESTNIFRSTVWPAYSLVGLAPSNPTRIDADISCPDTIWLTLADGLAKGTGGGAVVTRQLTSGRIDDLSLGPLAGDECGAEELWLSPGQYRPGASPWYSELWVLREGSFVKALETSIDDEFITHLFWSTIDDNLYMCTLEITPPTVMRVYRIDRSAYTATEVVSFTGSGAQTAESIIDSAQHGDYIYLHYNAYFGGAGANGSGVRRFDPVAETWVEVLNYFDDFGGDGYAGGIAVAADGKLVASDGSKAYRSATGDNGDWVVDYDLETFDAFDNFALCTNLGDGYIYGGQNDPLTAADPAIIVRTGDGVWVNSLIEDITGDGMTSLCNEVDSEGVAIAIYAQRWSFFDADPTPEIWRKPTGESWVRDWAGPASNAFAGLYSQGVVWSQEKLYCLVWDDDPSPVTRLYRRDAAGVYVIARDWADDYYPLATHASCAPMCTAPNSLTLTHHG